MNTPFQFIDGKLSCEGVLVEKLCRDYKTPLYIYSRQAIVDRCRQYTKSQRQAVKVCFAMKANSTLEILRIVTSLGLGVDVVSLGEMARVERVGVCGQDIIFSGVGKTDAEIIQGLEREIFSFHVESLFELERIDHFSKQLGKPARVSIRMNLDIDPHTSAYVTTGLYENKFGVCESDVASLLRIIQSNRLLKLVGVGCHLGSQIVDLRPFQAAAKRLVVQATALRGEGYPIEFVDLGGGLGVPYGSETVPAIDEYLKALVTCVEGSGLILLIEPGRSIVAPAGILATSVLGLKATPKRAFCVVDAAMNDLLRPSLYQARHSIVCTQERRATQFYDVVGPICETGDFLGKEVRLPRLARGDILAVLASGAYGMSMASNYNSRPRAAEVMVSGGTAQLIRHRETLDQLWSLETDSL